MTGLLQTCDKDCTGKATDALHIQNRQETTSQITKIRRKIFHDYRIHTRIRLRNDVIQLAFGDPDLDNLDLVVVECGVA
jgi:hypothetical protein